MKVCIYGAGAIGGFIGTRLGLAGDCTVSAVARGATLAALQAHGLRLRQGGELFSTPVQASDDPAALGVQDLVVIAVKGQSLPEVAASVMAALKGERDIAVGNVVGSSTFNILGCLGLSGIVSGDLGLAVPAAILNFDIWVMIAVSLACLPVFMTGREIARWEGGVFLLYYFAYASYLILATQQHAMLGVFSTAMMSFAVPITLITLVVVLVRRGPRKDDKT